MKFKNEEEFKEVFELCIDRICYVEQHFKDALEKAKEKGWIEKSALEKARDKYNIIREIKMSDDTIHVDHVGELKDLYEKAIAELQGERDDRKDG